ncbi:MAG: transglycosylase domain-containing protein [Akkermansiaceae bacterium]
MSWKPSKKPSKFPDWIPPRLRGFIRWCLKWGLVSFTLLVAIVLFYFYLALKYELADVARMPERSVIMDRHGIEFAAIHGERRRLITRDEIPDVMVQALRAREDMRFPEHHGVDVKGLARATLRNIRDMSFTQGASTLTMQLTRNTYDLRAKSLHRKFLEMAITLRIEARYEKDEILTHYLNRIYFGAGCHGVEEAAQTYFGRSVSDLNTGECALLVGIIRGPHLFSPFRNLEGAKIQRDEVLGRMVVSGFLTEEEKASAIEEPIRLIDPEERNRDSSYLRESLRSHLQIILDQHDIRAGGLRIYTTVDAALQKRMQQKLAEPLPSLEQSQLSELQAAMVSLHHATGGILALSGGRDYSASPYNRAYLVRRDLGPAFTPFLTAMALERNQLAISGQPVQTGRQLGIEETIRLSKRLGFSGPFAETEDLYRGTMAASPIELALAATALAGNGNQPTTFIISKITDTSGKILYQRNTSSSQVIRKDVANEAVAMLSPEGQALTTVTGSRHDAWGISVNKESSTVIWLGYDKPKKIGSSSDIKKALRHALQRD